MFWLVITTLRFIWLVVSLLCSIRATSSGNSKRFFLSQVLLFRRSQRKRWTGHFYRQELWQVRHRRARTRSRDRLLARAHASGPWRKRGDLHAQHHDRYVTVPVTWLCVFHFVLKCQSRDCQWPFNVTEQVTWHTTVRVISTLLSRSRDTVHDLSTLLNMSRDTVRDLSTFSL